jgi:hypothetical protein
MHKLTVTQTYTWHINQPGRPDQDFLVCDEIIGLGLIAYLKMRAMLDPRLMARVEHVAISWGRVYWDRNIPPLIFTVKMDFPSYHGEITIASQTMIEFNSQPIQCKEDAELFGARAAQIIASLLEDDTATMVQKLEELQISTVATLASSAVEEQNCADAWEALPREAHRHHIVDPALA